MFYYRTKCRRWIAMKVWQIALWLKKRTLLILWATAWVSSRVWLRPAGLLQLGFTAAPLAGVYFVCVRTRTPAADMLIRPCSSTQIRSDRPTRTALMRLLWVMLSDNRRLDSVVTPTNTTWRREKPLQASEAQERKVKVHKLINDKMGLRYRDVCLVTSLCEMLVCDFTDRYRLLPPRA